MKEFGVVGAERRVARRGRGPQLAPDLAVHHDRHAELGAPATLAEPLRDERHLGGVVDARSVRLALQQEGLDRRELVERVLLVGREAHLTPGELTHVHQHLQRAPIQLGAGDRHRGRAECGTSFFGRHLERLHQVVGSSHGASQRGQGRQSPHWGPGRVERTGGRALHDASPIGGHGGWLSGPLGPFSGPFGPDFSALRRLRFHAHISPIAIAGYYTWVVTAELLRVEGLHVRPAPDEVAPAEILQGVDLVVRPGEVHASMGPNASGKSTFASALSPIPVTRSTSGRIWFKGDDVTDWPTDVRAKSGMFLAFQYPQEIAGVSVIQFLRQALSARKGIDLSVLELRLAIMDWMKRLDMDPSFADRYLNEGFSGGEKKRNEVLQMAILEPELAVLDETDSGLDIDASRSWRTACKRCAAIVPRSAWC